MLGAEGGFTIDSIDLCGRSFCEENKSGNSKKYISANKKMPMITKHRVKMVCCNVLP